MSGESVRDGLVVNRIYVIRRELGKSRDSIPIYRNVVAHSGLLLRTVSDRYFVLEYQGDSVAYLTETPVILLRSFPEKRYVYIAAKGHDMESVKVFYWTRQLSGTELQTALSLTPHDLQHLMSAVMPRGYGLHRFDTCHTAQERLRRLLATWSAD